jgi:hypothetical protein
MSIQNEAMRVRVSFSVWNPRVIDAAATGLVKTNFKTADDAGAFVKNLVGKDDLKEVQRIVRETRRFFYKNTMPWDDNGDRLLPTKVYMDYKAGMRNFRHEFEYAVSQFMAKYPSIVADAPTKLGALYNPDDFPGTTNLKEKFAIRTVELPVEDADDFRVSVSEQEKEKIKTKIRARVEENTQKAMRDLWERLYDGVGHLSATLNGKNVDSKGELRDKTFRDALIVNVVELTEILPRLNIANDPNLEQMCKEVQNKLCGNTPDALRKNKHLKQQVAADANDIIDKMAAFMGASDRNDNDQAVKAA